MQKHPVPGLTKVIGVEKLKRCDVLLVEKKTDEWIFSQQLRPTVTTFCGFGGWKAVGEASRWFVPPRVLEYCIQIESYKHLDLYIESRLKQMLHI